jgi:hypothetical protein
MFAWWNGLQIASAPAIEQPGNPRRLSNWFLQLIDK